MICFSRSLWSGSGSLFWGRCKQRSARLELWQRYTHRRAPRRSAFNLRGPTEPLGALAHRLQTQVARESSRGIKAHAIILDLQNHARVCLVQAQRDPLCPGMFDNVVERFLRDAVERFPGIKWESWLRAEIEIDGKIV